MNRSRSSCLLLFVLSFLAYANTLKNGFVYDDRIIIERNPLLGSLEGIPRLLLTPYWTGEGRANRLYRPATTASFALNRVLLGGGSGGYHLINAVLHGSVVVLVFLLLRDLFGTTMMAGLAAALFSVHPALTEAVAGLVGRADILSALFVLLALKLDRSAGNGPGGRRVMGLLGSLGCFLLALLSKENALAYPGLVLLTDALLGLPPGLSRRRRWAEFAGVLGTAGLYLSLRAWVLGRLMEPESIPRVDNLLAHVPASERMLTALGLAARYLGLFLYPARLSVDYSAPEIPPVTRAADARLWAGILVMGAALAVFYFCRRRLVPLSWGIGFAGASFFLVSNIPFPIGTVFAERLLYLPAVGLCAAVGFLGAVAAEKRPKVTLGVAAGVLALLGLRTWDRNRDWRDDFTLFRSAARVSGRSARVRYNLGNAYRRRGDLQRAAENYRLSLDLFPEFEPARRNLGVVLVDMGRAGESVELFQAALERAPDSASLHNNLGNAYRAMGRLDEAEAEYRRAAVLESASADPRNNLGILFQERGAADRAEQEYREAIRLDPKRIPFRVNLGNLLLQSSRFADAADVFREAVQLSPSLPEPHRGLGEALLDQGSMEEAEAELRLSLSLGPKQWEAPALLGYLYQRRGDRTQAIRFYGDSLSVKPDQMELHRNLGLLYAAMPGQERQALDHLRRCLDLGPPAASEPEIRRLMESLAKRSGMRPGAGRQ